MQGQKNIKKKESKRYSKLGQQMSTLLSD